MKEKLKKTAKYGGLVIFGLVLLAAGLAFFEQSPAPSISEEPAAATSTSPIVVEELSSGEKVVRNVAGEVEFKVASIFHAEDNSSNLNAVQPNGTMCRLIVNAMGRVEDGIDGWLRWLDSQAEVSITSRMLTRIPHDELEVYLYDLKIKETGTNRIMYVREPKSMLVTQIVAYSSDSAGENNCYGTLDYILDTLDYYEQ